MAQASAAEIQLAELLVKALNLEGIDAAAVDPEMPLFGSAKPGWGLDSIDALEIALAVQQQYGVELRADDVQTRSAFASIRTLMAHIDGQRRA